MVAVDNFLVLCYIETKLLIWENVMTKKRLLSFFLILTLWLGLTACNATGTMDFDVTVDSTTTTTAVSTTVTDAPTDGTTDTTAIPSGDGTTTTVVTPSSSNTTATTTTTTTTTITTTQKPTTTATTVSAADKQLVDRAFQLAQGEKIEGVTLTGVVTSSQGYSAGYGNATFDLQVQGTSGAKTIYCYRVKPADPSHTDVAVGDRLSLTGTIQNYKGTIEFYPADYTHLGGGAVVTTTTRPTGSGTATIDENGIYDSKEEVGLYIHLYGKLPKNYVTKSQYNKDKYLCVGGDRFYNKEGRLPSGEIYYECDIDTYGSTSRGAKRLVWTKSGIVYYTGDHYETFTQLYGERE